MSRVPAWLRVESLLGLALLAVVLYAVLYEPFQLVVESPTLPPGRLSATLRGTSAALVSDLYPRALGYREQQLAAHVQDKNPALLLFAGGFQGGTPEALEALLGSLTKDRAAFAVLRPEEAGDAKLRALLQKAGVRVLDNERVSLTGDLSGVELLGVVWPGALPRLLETRDPSQPAIVLAPGLSLLAPFADALLLEVADSPTDPAAEWRPVRGSWRFSQPNEITLPDAKPRRVRIQAAIPGALIDEVRFSQKGAADVVVPMDQLPSNAVRGRFALLPGSSFGRKGTLLDANSATPQTTAAQPAPESYAEFPIELPAGTYQVEIHARTRGQSQGAVWLQVEGATTQDQKPRYQLGTPYSFPEAGAVDLIVTGGPLGGKLLPWTRLARHLFPDDQPPEYWKYLSGLFDLKGVPLYVTRGVNTPGIPVRLGAPPELTLFSW